MLYAFFWVIPRRLNFICRRFGTLCLFHLRRQVGACTSRIMFIQSMLSILELPTCSVKVIIITQAASREETTIVYGKSSTGSGPNWWQCEQSNKHHSCTG